MSTRKVSRRWRALVSLVATGTLAAGISSCSGCRNKAPLAFVPADAMAVVVVPSISDLVIHLNKLSDKLKGGMIAGALLDRQTAAIKAELGFDPQKPQTMRKIGIDPEQGMVASFAAGERATIVLGVADRKALDAYLRGQLQKTTSGAAVFKDKTVANTKLTVVSIAGREDVAAWTFVKDKYLVVGGGKQSGASAYVAGITKLEKSIKDNPTFIATSKQLGKTDVMVYIDGKSVGRMVGQRFDRGLETASDWMKSYIRERKQTSEAALAYFAGLGLGLEVESDRLALKGFYAAPSAEKAKILRDIVSGVGEGLPLAKYIGPDALVVGRAAFNLKQAMEKGLELLPSSRKRSIYRKLERAERENNLSFDKDILGQLAGRFAVALYPPRGKDLSTPPRGFADATRSTPAVMLAQVNDATRVAELLARLERFLVMKGLDIRPRSEGANKHYTLQIDGRPVVGWTVHEKLLVIATGDRLGMTLGLIDKGGENVLSSVTSKRAKAGLKQDNGMVLHADVNKIGDMVRGLDLGLEIKAMLAPMLSAVSKFKDLTVTAEPADNGLAGQLAISLN